MYQEATFAFIVQVWAEPEFVFRLSVSADPTHTQLQSP